jgi:putative acyl-CoA dehydrogenase
MMIIDAILQHDGDTRRSHEPFDTHEVFNQAPPFGDVNLLKLRPALREALAREGGGWAHVRSWRARRAPGPRRGADAGAPGQRVPPRLVNFDRSGRRIDEVEFHPAWHQLMRC